MTLNDNTESSILVKTILILMKVFESENVHEYTNTEQIRDDNKVTQSVKCKIKDHILILRIFILSRFGNLQPRAECPP